MHLWPEGSRWWLWLFPGPELFVALRVHSRGPDRGRRTIVECAGAGTRTICATVQRKFSSRRFLGCNGANAPVRNVRNVVDKKVTNHFREPFSPTATLKIDPTPAIPHISSSLVVKLFRFYDFLTRSYRGLSSCLKVVYTFRCITANRYQCWRLLALSERLHF